MGGQLISLIEITSGRDLHTSASTAALMAAFAGLGPYNREVVLADGC